MSGPGVLGLPRMSSAAETASGPRSATQAIRPGCGNRFAFAASTALSSAFCFASFSLAASFGTWPQLLLQASDLGVDLLLLGLPRSEDGRRRGLDHAIVGLDPLVEVERRRQDRMELVILLLRDRLELVIVAFRTLEREPQERRADDLDGAVEHGNLVGADLVGVAVALARSVLSIAEEMRGDELIDDLGSDRDPGPVARELVAGQLLADDLVEGFVGIERARIT